MALIKILSFFQSGDDNALAPFAPRIAKDLGPFLPVASEDTLGLVLETLSVIVEVDKGRWVTADLAISLVEAVLAVWHKNNRGTKMLFLTTPVAHSFVRSHLHFNTHRYFDHPRWCIGIRYLRSRRQKRTSTFKCCHR